MTKTTHANALEATVPANMETGGATEAGGEEPIGIEITVGGRRAWVYQRKIGGVRQEKFYVTGNLPGGKQFRRSTGFSTKSMAVDAAKKLWRAALEGRFDVLEQTKLVRPKVGATIGEVVRAHALAETKGVLGLKGGTGQQYRSSLRRLVAWARDLHALPEGGKRERIDEAGVDRLPASVLTDELVEEFARRYLAPAGGDFLARDERLRGAHTVLRNARAMFEGSAMTAYRGLVLPELVKFKEAKLKRAEAVEHAPLSDAAVAAMARTVLPLAGKDPALYVTHLLFRHLGMRNDEIEHARVEWVERFTPARKVWLPDGQVREVVAVMNIKRRADWVPKRSAGEVPIAPEVLAELEPWLAGKPDQFIVPGETVTARWETINRRHADLIRPWTENCQKKSYELRRWAATKVATLHQSEEMAERFLRHGKKTTAARHYLTARPLPAPITLADCGL